MEVKQVVNIGAGFDTLAWRLSGKMPLINFIEIDHPATSTEKVKALFDDSRDLPNLHFVAADLSKQNIQSVLGAYEGFDPKLKTLYICEGVLMYLEEESVEELFDALKNLSGTGTAFIFSCMEPTKSPKNNIRPLLHLYLSIKNERYNWYIREEELPDFTKKHGFTVIETANSDDYRERYLGNDKQLILHQGEYLALTVAE